MEALRFSSKGVDEGVELWGVFPVSGSQRNVRGPKDIDDEHQSLPGGLVERLVQLAVVENNDLAFNVVSNLQEFRSRHGKRQAR